MVISRTQYLAVAACLVALSSPVICTNSVGLLCADEKEAPHWSISVDTSGGLAGSGFGSVAIESNGTISVVTQPDVTRGSLSESELKTLKEAVRASEPKKWQEEYRGTILDGYSFNLRLTLGAGDENTTHSVSWGQGAIQLPADLRSLFAAVQSPWDRLRGARPILDKEMSRKLKTAAETFVITAAAATTDNSSISILNSSGESENQTFTVLLRPEGPNGGIIIFDVSGADIARITKLDMSALEPISEVKTVGGTIGNGKLVANVKGIVASTGWSDPALLPVHYFLPPSDGIYEFTFVARKPQAVTAPLLSPIEIKDLSIELLRSLKGIRVRSSTNSYVLRITQHQAGDLPEAKDDIELFDGIFRDEAVHVDVKYAGGLREHAFELVWNDMYLESSPPVAVMRLVHNANRDPGEARLSDTLHFALPALEPCIIRIDSGKGTQIDVRYKIDD